MKKQLLALVSVFLLLNLAACGTTGKPAPVSKPVQVSKQPAPVPDTAHNSRNSLDWSGVYTGVIPAASAAGIKVVMTLNTDETYRITYQYIGKGNKVYPHAGKFKWNESGSVVILDDKNLPPYYKVGENILIQLDMEGNEITGDLASRYILKKKM